ncbi:hypothetical protein GFJ91_20785 [Salmonella enterica subsp. enterica serovar Enteritidis]|nr:hypothetical protein [Salmonella enterica subsp. enterica serovar Enteritidis]
MKNIPNLIKLLITGVVLAEDPRWNALHEEFSFDDDDNLLGMNMPPEGGEHQAKVKGDRLLLQGRPPL